jgi:hypothetical protein
VMKRLCPADARTTEELEAGNLHVRLCTGGPGNWHAYRSGAKGSEQVAIFDRD